MVYYDYFFVEQFDWSKQMRQKFNINLQWFKTFGLDNYECLCWKCNSIPTWDILGTKK